MTSLRTLIPFLSTPLRDPSSVSGPPSTNPSQLPRSADFATPRKGQMKTLAEQADILGKQRRSEIQCSALQRTKRELIPNPRSRTPNTKFSAQLLVALQRKREQKGRITFSAPDQLRQCEVVRAGIPSHHPGPAEMSALTTAQHDSRQMC